MPPKHPGIVVRSSAQIGIGRRERVFWTCLAGLWFFWFWAETANWMTTPVYTEETVNGNLTRGILEGLIAPPWFYQYIDVTPGPLVYGVLLVPFYAVMGSNMLAMKLLGMLFAGGGVWLWTANVRRNAGLVSAAVFAVWMIFPPPTLHRLFHLTWANHMEAIFFSGLLYWLWDRSFDSRAKHPAVRDAGFGALAGFAVYFCLQNVIAVAALGLAWLWRAGRKDLRRILWPLLPAFIAGLSPFAIAAFATRHVSFSLEGGASTTPVLVKLQALVFRFAPAMAQYSRPWLSLLFAVTLAAGVILVAWRYRPAVGRSTAEATWFGRFLALYTLVYFAAYAFTSYELGGIPYDPRYTFRYIVPLFPVGMAAAVLAARDGAGRYGGLLLAPLLIASVVESGPLTSLTLAAERVAQGDFARELRCTRGDDYRVLMGQSIAGYWSWGLKLGPDLREDGYLAWKRSVDPLPDGWKEQAYESFGAFVGTTAGLRYILADGSVPMRWRLAAITGAGRSFAANLNQSGGLPFVDQDVIRKGTEIFTGPSADVEAAFAQGLASVVWARVRVAMGGLAIDDPDRRRAVREAFAARMALSQDPGDPLTIGVVRALARYMGEVGGYDPDPSAIVSDIVGPTDDPELVEAFVDEYALGRALWAMAGYRCLYGDALIAEAPVIGRGLDRLGVALEPDGDVIRLVETAGSAYKNVFE